MSFEICHLSFEICHLSFEICHLSFVICHLSFVICHLSFVIEMRCKVIGFGEWEIQSFGSFKIICAIAG
ncbi:MAG: hypothetical protein F6K31_12985 [Symploca sp. SIO2G7]|nr:hypothetical protein [Symploca sp. SIO2G7]